MDVSGMSATSGSAKVLLQFQQRFSDVLDTLSNQLTQSLISSEIKSQLKFGSNLIRSGPSILCWMPGRSTNAA